MNIPILAGRPFTAQDRAGAQRVAIVSTTLAERLWPGESALGRSLSLDPEGRDSDELLTVVGVVNDTHRGVGGDRTPMLYLALQQFAEFATFDDLYLSVRADGVDPAVAARHAVEVLQTVDATVPVGAVQTMREHLGSTLMTHQLGLTLFALFASLAALLTGLGLYAVIAYAVAGRAREIGIRVALGASRRTVLALTARQGLAPIAGGLALGAALFAMAASAIRGFMFSLPVLDVWSTGAVVLGVAGLAAAAMLVPMQRALGVDPSTALRS
jgi:ABC-type antimicrobial peptide transport system permease subunit